MHVLIDVLYPSNRVGHHAPDNVSHKDTPHETKKDAHQELKKKMASLKGERIDISSISKSGNYIAQTTKFKVTRCWQVSVDFRISISEPVYCKIPEQLQCIMVNDGMPPYQDLDKK